MNSDIPYFNRCIQCFAVLNLFDPRCSLLLEVIEINDFLLGTMAGGAADCSYGLPELRIFFVVGTRGAWDYPSYSKPIPPFLHLWKGCWDALFDYDCAQVLGAPLESIMPNAWVEREGTGSAATVLRVGCVTIRGTETPKIFSMLRGSYLLMWQFHSKYCASFVKSFKIRFMT